MKIGIVGASGYAGGELLRLLSAHPHFDISYISAGTNAGELVTSVHPALTAFAGVRFAETNSAEMNKCDLLFIALPHGESSKIVTSLLPDIKVVDLGADYRLSSADQWSKYYGGSYAGKWCYGLPEITGATSIAASSRVATPGCYATSIALSIAPAIKLGAVDASDITVVAASGTTGAGRSAKVNLLGSEVMNSLTSYKFGGAHQHTPEIEETLSAISQSEVKVLFTPILAPMPRGILATVTAKMTKEVSLDQVRHAYEQFYGAGFVHILAEGSMPQTSAVLGTNQAHIQLAIDAHTNRLVVSCAIDNLGKGAAGQAIHNANLMAGLPADSGLTAMGAR